MDVLVANENAEQETDGIIEDDEHGEDVMHKDYTGRRWVRIIRSCLGLTQTVPGFEILQDSEGTRFDLGEAMMRKAELWKEEERREREEDERRRNRHWDDEDDVDMDLDYEEEEEELDDDPTVRALQVRIITSMARPILILYYRRGVSIYEIYRMARRRSVEQTMCPTADRLTSIEHHSSFVLATLFLLSTRTSFFPRYPWCQLSSKVNDGRSLFPWPSLRNWTESPQTNPNLEEPRLLHHSTSLITFVHTLLLSKYRPPAETILQRSTCEVRTLISSHAMDKRMERGGTGGKEVLMT
jgi:hypothetical protein